MVKLPTSIRQIHSSNLIGESDWNFFIFSSVLTSEWNSISNFLQFIIIIIIIIIIINDFTAWLL
jgi:hypothetical protein